MKRNKPTLRGLMTAYIKHECGESISKQFEMTEINDFDDVQDADLYQILQVVNDLMNSDLFNHLIDDDIYDYYKSLSDYLFYKSITK